MGLVRTGIIAFGLLCLLFSGSAAYAVGCVGANNVAEGSNVVSGAVVDSSCLGTKLPANGYITYTPAYPGAVPYCLINNSSNSYFVPGKSATEWSAFETAIANGRMKSFVTMNGCTGTVPNGYLTFGCPTCTINCNPGYTLSGNSTTGSCVPKPPPAPSCTPSCGNTNSYCIGTTYSNGCNGTCYGTSTTGSCAPTPPPPAAASPTGSWIKTAGTCAPACGSSCTAADSYSCIGGNGRCAGSPPSTSSTYTGAACAAPPQVHNCGHCGIWNGSQCVKNPAFDTNSASGCEKS